MSEPTKKLPPIFIRRSKDPNGWMGNMSPFSVEYAGLRYRTSEALFQCLRFDPRDTVCEEIRLEKSPVGAKKIAERNAGRRVVEPMSQADLANMKLCLMLKIRQHPELEHKLMRTRGRKIIEDCSRRRGGRGLFWGLATNDEGRWVIGSNWLGNLWMNLREDIRSEHDRGWFEL